MATIQGVTASSVSKSIHGLTSTNSETVSYQITINQYQLLYTEVIKDLNTYIKYYTRGEYNNLIKNFTRPNYNRLVYKATRPRFNTDNVKNLVDFKYDPTVFESMRQSTYNVIDGLEKTVSLAQQNITYQSDISGLNYYKSVLEDPVKLSEYIDNQRLNVMVFQATETFQSQILLKPWFEEYFRLYGPPGNGVFQSELLADIVLDLISRGIITQEQFTNTT